MLYYVHRDPGVVGRGLGKVVGADLEMQLRMQYAMTIIRLVNGISDSSQKKKVASSVAALATNAGGTESRAALAGHNIQSQPDGNSSYDNVLVKSVKQPASESSQGMSPKYIQSYKWLISYDSARGAISCHLQACLASWSMSGMKQRTMSSQPCHCSDKQQRRLLPG